MPHLTISILIIINLGLDSYSSNLYQSYTLIYDPLKSSEWSDDHILTYITTVRLSNYDHHIFQYRRYPCQYFYTDEIEIKHNNETFNQCMYNTATSDYAYNFQIHLTFHHMDSFILRNIAIQCKYVNCSLSLLKVKSTHIDWNKNGNLSNINCSFNTIQTYNITNAAYPLTDWITLRCNSLSACNHSKYNIEHELSSNIQLIYSSLYEIEKPYCSLEKNLAYIIETNFLQTNRLLEQLIDLIQRGFGKPNEREQVHMKEYIEHIENKWINNNMNSTTNATEISGEVQGIFIHTKH
ncbi:unnamed protein product [Rotaria socialis]|uniref:Uncharacterized protein n=1 Tax=Rotaria socialis TaxID=392032 RepID=A0A820XFH5_9BILA|nr:unnamed protein product [Rotaria socialis]CAF4529065.1 unnamed protein product [Rotaria socialis]